MNTRGLRVVWPPFVGYPRICSNPISYIPGCGTRNLGELLLQTLVAHDCGYPLSRYTCRATRAAADFLEFIAFCRCSSGVAPHPLKVLVSHLSPPPIPGGVAPKFGSEKVSRYMGVSQVQLRVSRYTVQLSTSLNKEVRLFFLCERQLHLEFSLCFFPLRLQHLEVLKAISTLRSQHLERFSSLSPNTIIA